ncbi:fucose mutarotase-like isoform X2 [Ostrea edulis]|uniref:fucose mutarotase-like isoform X2 n=1 Tax=Ostrea edulis TaxID=37623 RepID=UPI002094137D|nr:fucose mutarotase-like isoform X2 [Ostrea edulis]
MPLKNVPKCLTPDLLHALASMGHGDEIMLADAHSPSSSLCKSGPIEVRADGKDQSTCILNVQIQTIKLNLPCMQPGIFLERMISFEGFDIPTLLDGILQLLPLDTYVKFPVALMDPVQSDKDSHIQIPVWDKYREIINKQEGPHRNGQVWKHYFEEGVGSLTPLEEMHHC